MFVLKNVCCFQSKFNKEIIKLEKINHRLFCTQPSYSSLISFRSYSNYRSTGELKLAFRKYSDSLNIYDVPVIVLHGLLGSKNNWNAVCRQLTKEISRPIIAVDARNHGESPHDNVFSYEEMVSDIMILMKDQKLEEASFIGHSMGGRTAMLLAQMYPEKVHSMVIVDISPVSQASSMVELPKLFSILQSLDVNHSLPLTEARKQAVNLLLQHKLDNALISFLMTNFVSTSKESIHKWGWRFNLCAIANNFESNLCKFPIVQDNVNTRTMFIAGLDSDYIRKEDESAIRKIFPNSQFTYIKDAGHWVHADKPVLFLQLVSEFFKQDPGKVYKA